MNILVIYLAVSDSLKTVYDIDGKYDHIEVGNYVVHDAAVRGWVVSLPGSVQEGNHILQSERPWLLEQGKNYAQAQTTATVPQ